tara:strand:- start:2157 stop:2348 length:192 start_codon:yes stop_codon:yes gene_type:complete
LVIIGSLGLLGYVAYELFVDTDIPIVLKVLAAVLIGGLVLGLGVVGQQRMVTQKADPYKDVQS